MPRELDLMTLPQQDNLLVTICDACVIEFQFYCADKEMVSQSSKVSIQYMFGSNEYCGYVSSDFNDAFAFFIYGVKIANLPDGVLT